MSSLSPLKTLTLSPNPLRSASSQSPRSAASHSSTSSFTNRFKDLAKQTALASYWDKARLPAALANIVPMLGSYVGGGNSGKISRLAEDGRDIPGYVIKRSLTGSDFAATTKGGHWARELAANQIVTDLAERLTKTNPTSAAVLKKGAMVAHCAIEIGEVPDLLLPDCSGPSGLAHFNAGLEDYIKGTKTAADVVDRLRDIFHDPIAALGVLHREEQLVMCDINPTNIQIEAATGQAKIFDFGAAARVGTHVEISTRLTTPPERIRSLGEEPEQPTAFNNPLSTAGDVLALGSSLYGTAHGKMMSWDHLDPGSHDLPEEMRLPETAAHFIATGTIFPENPASPTVISPNLRIPPFHRLEGNESLKHALWTELKQRGFYDLVEKCMRPNPQDRLTVDDMLMHRFFTQKTDKPSIQ